MFEKYTEKARRVVFFARYEARDDGSPYAETEHLLLRICCDDRRLMSRMLRSKDERKKLEHKLRHRLRPARPKMPTAVDLPLSEQSKRVLACAAEEAERLGHRHIGVAHLLLGLMREKGCEAARALMESGLTIRKARAVAAQVNEATVHETIGADLGRPLRTSLELVDDATGERLDVWPLHPLAPLPRIGEQVLTRDEQHPLRPVRVVDVIYEFNGPRLETIQLRVKRLPQDPAAS